MTLKLGPGNHIQLKQTQEIPRSIAPVIGWPKCAVCQKEVEKLLLENHPLTLSMRLIIRCHGEEEFVPLDIHEMGMLTRPNWMEDFKAGKVVRFDGIAFEKKALPEPAKEIDSGSGSSEV